MVHILKKYWVVLLVGVLFSCDDTMSQLQKENERPTAHFTYLENEINVVSDSIKLNSTFPGNDYHQDITISDPEGYLKGSILQNNKRLW